MVKIIQTKYIKQLFIFLVFASLLSYQQNANAGSADEVSKKNFKRSKTSISTVQQIMSNNGIPGDIVGGVGGDMSNPLTSQVLAVAVGNKSRPRCAKCDSYYTNFRNSEVALYSILTTENENNDVSYMATVMAMDTLSLLVSLIDELIDIGNASVTPNETHYVEITVGWYEQKDVFDQLLNYLTNRIQTGEHGRVGMRNDDPDSYAKEKKPLETLKSAFDSGNQDAKVASNFLDGGPLLQSKDECSDLFCSLYMQRIKNPDLPIHQFVVRELTLNEIYSEAYGMVEYIRALTNNNTAEEYWLLDLWNEGNDNRYKSAIYSLRQSRAATQTVLPGNDPNAGQQQQQQQPVISEECQMAPSMPGC